MSSELDPTERRLLGVLIEKQLSTPDAYPLSLNALVLGANQKSCRDPITSYADWEVEGAVTSLCNKKWAMHIEGGRVRRWRHQASEKLGIDKAGLAVLAELLLRGSQQPAELRRNAGRLNPIHSDEEMQAILDQLAAKLPPLVKNIGRAPRERDVRWTQTLAPDELPDGSGPSGATAFAPPSPSPMVGGSTPTPAQLLARIEALEHEVAELKRSLGA